MVATTTPTPQDVTDAARAYQQAESDYQALQRGEYRTPYGTPSAQEAHAVSLNRRRTADAWAHIKFKRTCALREQASRIIPASLPIVPTNRASLTRALGQALDKIERGQAPDAGYVIVGKWAGPLWHYVVGDAGEDFSAEAEVVLAISAEGAVSVPGEGAAARAA